MPIRNVLLMLWVMKAVCCLCSWPKGGKLSLPFVYSDEVWTGIEHQVASHLMLMGHVKEGLDIVRAIPQPL